jgi:hypothetical protein
MLESWTGFIPLLHELYQCKEEFLRFYDAGCEQDAYERYLTWQQQIPPSATRGVSDAPANHASLEVGDLQFLRDGNAADKRLH